MLSRYPFCIVDPSGVVVANFERMDLAIACCRYFAEYNVHVEERR